MRNILLVFVVTALPVSMAAAADPLAPRKPFQNATSIATPGQPLPSKRSRGDTCAAFGRGFVKVDGTDTCIKLGGAISVGVSGGR